ncbi:transmembrane emp24 domain-containing protein 1-like isoform X1 [Clavelina lepadiformis]|uniref:transmembrane emp24 domain-containing protein 1-like isoform X1 n=1 Tax=Clavelina lepadiformis TaxID=159417 RepID=UPI004043782A
MFLSAKAALACFLLVLSSWAVSGYRDNDLTAEIPAARRECFYQPTKQGQVLEIEYQVIDGGDLDIDFRMNAPNGNKIVQEFRRNDGIHTVDATMEGDYEICFDNGFSRFTKKTIYFEIILDSGEEDDELDDDEGEWKKFISPDDTFGDKLTSLEVAGDTMNQIKSYQSKVIQLQGLLRAFEAKDRNIVERNFNRINFWSVTNIFIMLVVFSLQVYMVRNMFSDKKKVRT